MAITREDLESGRLKQLFNQANLGIQALTEAELQSSLQQTLSQNPGQQVWLFAYGSLIWNPLIEFADRQIGTIHGFHRRFCLWAALGRGTPDNPGLVLGLDRGGSCRGVLYRIPDHLVEPELMLVWRREMIVGSYEPRWVKVRCQSQTCYAITFLINRNHCFYTGNIATEVVVHHLATAGGVIGSCADYLHQTIEGLAQAGIYDRGLLFLQKQVIEKQRAILNNPG